MRRFALILPAVLSLAVFCRASDIKKVTAEYTYYAPESMSLEEAKRVALDRAKIQAIADEFGTIVTQSTSTRITNKNGESDTEFFALGGSDVKGEWIETTKGPEYDVAYADGMLVVRVKANGKIKRLGDVQIPLDAKILRNGFDDRNEDDTFRNGDDMFLRFQSPVDGNLLVYLVDHTADAVFCLLPYNGSSLPSASIEHDKNYIFFSSDRADELSKNEVDEYTMTCGSGSETEHNEIILLFSPDCLIKGNSALPRQMPLTDFNRWYSKLLSSSATIQTIKKPITITKN